MYCLFNLHVLTYYVANTFTVVSASHPHHLGNNMKFLALAVFSLTAVPAYAETCATSAPSSMPSSMPSSTPTTAPPSANTKSGKSPKSNTAASSKGGKGGKGGGYGRKLLSFEFHDEITAPWAEPNHANSELIVEAPGIWKIPDFLNNGEVLLLKESLDEEHSRFETCVGYVHEHLDCKSCFRLTLDNCRDDDECALLSKIFERIYAIWPTIFPQRDYLYVQRYEPGCGETLIHKDTKEGKTATATSTQVLYLSSGGGKVYFPNALPEETAIEPAAGALLTWLNVHPDGTDNDAAHHGIEANPVDAGVRYSLSYRVHFDEHQGLHQGLTERELDLAPSPTCPPIN